MIWRRALLLVSCAVLPACTAGPDYAPPKPNLPAKFTEQTGSEGAAVNFADEQWWDQLQDPILNGLIYKAFRNSPDITEAEARVRQARAYRGIVDSRNYPTVSAGSAYDRTHGSGNVPIGVPPGGLGPDQTGNLWQAGFDASWEIDIFGGTRRAIESASATVSAVQEDRHDVGVTLIAEIARDYVQLRAQQARLKTAQEIEALATDSLKLTQAAFDSSLATKLDVERAKAELYDSKAAVPEMEAEQRAAIYKIGTLVGVMPEALVSELQASRSVPSANITIPAGLPSELLERRPDIRASERRIAAANARIGVAEADLYPHFFLTGATGLESLSANTFLDSRSGYYSIGPSITWLLFDAGRVRNEILEERAKTDIAAAEYQRIILAALSETETALAAYGQEKLAIKERESEVSSSREAFDLANRLYAQGLENYLSVIDAERALRESEDKLTVARARFATALISLYKALGGGWRVAERAAAVGDGG